MRNKYSFSEFISTTYAFVITKLFYKGARLIRRPIYIRGKKSMKFDEGLTTGHGCRFDLPGEKKTLFIGENCEMGDNTHIVAHEKVVIGSNVLVASKVFISDTNHGVYGGEYQDSPEIIPNNKRLVTAPVIIGSNTWIGENVVILAGANIGEGSIIGANSVVTGNINHFTIAVGAPAREVKKYNFENKVWEHC